MTSQGKKKKQVCRCYTAPLNNDYEKLAKPDCSFHNLSMTRDHLKCCLCLMKKVGMKGSISKCSAQKAVSQALKQVLAVEEGESGDTLWLRLCVAKTFSRKRNISLKRKQIRHQIEGRKLSSLHEFNYGGRQDSLGEAEELGYGEEKIVQIQHLREVSRSDSNSIKDDDQSTKVPFRSISIIQRELPESNIGWPLFRKKSSLDQEALKARKARNKSFIEWISSLPSRVSQIISNNQVDSNSSRTTMSSSTTEDNSVVDDSATERTDSQLNDNFQDNKFDGSCYGEEESSLVQEVSSSSAEDSPKSRPGWPLLRIKNAGISDSLEKSEAEDSSFGHSNEETKLQSDSDSISAESSIDEATCFPEDKRCKAQLIPSEMQQNKLELVKKLNSCGCNLFSYEELKLATNHFSAENLIGEGGCSNVFKGKLPGGKAIAVKVLKHYKEAWNDFSLEVDIMSSLKHEHITPLVGVCNEDEYLILVYDFLIGGSLEETLQGRKGKPVLPWKARFKVAVAIAEALSYLHNNSSQPVIHRDVKSSNILLSKDYQPQLSDFGLAVWRPENSTDTADTDLVGTFGYIAPEYFMHGVVSDKVDVYSYGVILLELLTGKKPISSGSRKRKQSLVQWATPLLENGNLEDFLDQNLKGKMNIAQIHKMVLAATLCIKQTAKLRPNINQVLKLLKGKEDEKKWFSSYITHLKENMETHIDECQPIQQQRQKLKDYLQQEQD